FRSEALYQVELPTSLHQSLVLLDSHRLKPVSNVDTCSIESLQCDAQVVEHSSYHHDTFCLIPHHLMNQQFPLVASCKFQFLLATLEYFQTLLSPVLVVYQLGTLHPSSNPSLFNSILTLNISTGIIIVNKSISVCAYIYNKLNETHY